MNEIDSQLNDLAALDMCFAEILSETGTNPIPQVCDGLDLSILETDNKTLTKLFQNAKQNMTQLVEKLGGERTNENNGYLDLIIDNFKEKIKCIESHEKSMETKECDYFQIYKETKQIQNKLGINNTNPSLNILTFFDESMDISAKTTEMLNVTENLKKFLLDGQKNYDKYIESEKSIDNLEYKDRENAKEQLQEKKREKMRAHELQSRQTRVFSRSQNERGR